MVWHVHFYQKIQDIAVLVIMRALAVVFARRERVRISVRGGSYRVRARVSTWGRIRIIAGRVAMHVRVTCHA